MSEFLSDAWIAALASAAPATTPDASRDDREQLVVEPIVRGVPGRGEVRYRLAFTAGGCTVTHATNGSGAADVFLETDYATAAALARGTTNAQAALADGRLRVSGDVARLAADAATLSRLGDLFAAVRGATTYPDAAARS